MRRYAVLATTAVFAAGLVTGCGGGDSDESGGSASGYCRVLESSAGMVKSFTVEGSTPDFSKFSEIVDRADELADKAPSAVEDDWKVVVGALDTLVEALDDAGIKVEDFPKLMAGQIPEGVDASKITALGAKLQEIRSAKVSKAGVAIRKHAKDECGIDLDKAG